MTRRNLMIRFVLAVAGVLGLAGPAVASSQVRLSGNLEGSESSTMLSESLLFAVLTASGEASHLGKYTLTMPRTVNLETRFSSGTFELVAANGDTLVGTLTGQGTLTETVGVISIVEDLVITGGTGRFEGATGDIQINRLLNRLISATAGTLEGTVSSPSAAH